MNQRIEILTKSNSGHTLHHNGVFSYDNQWVVFDTRNEDTKIGETSSIGILNVFTREIKTIYTTPNQTLFGPGVGAASFSPIDNRVIFIHGLPSANEKRPYSISRRTGFGLNIDQPNKLINFDARDCIFPYTPGSLRGGTHAHNWSKDAKFISFTYNDDFVESDLRTVGVMFETDENIVVDSASENLNGTMYASIVTEVVKNPKWGSDEISKAFDECWINGYINSEGKIVSHAIAFQGNVINSEGQQVTEVFVVDIDKKMILNDPEAVGEIGQRPRVPKGIKQRRLTFSTRGISETRHWLRASLDGKSIFALARDEKNHNQIVEIDILSGEIMYLTSNTFSIDYTFNLSHDGQKILYVANNSIYCYHLITKENKLIFQAQSLEKIIGAPSFSNDDRFFVFNQYLLNDSNEAFLQILKFNCSDNFLD